LRPAIVHRAHLAIPCIARLLSCNLAVLRRLLPPTSLPCRVARIISLTYLELLVCFPCCLASFASPYLATSLPCRGARHRDHPTSRSSLVTYYTPRAVQFHPNGSQSDFARPPARTMHPHGMGVHRTRGEPNEIKKNPHPENINNFRSFLCAGRAELIHSMRYGSKKRFLTNGTRLKWIGGRNLRIWRGKRGGM
jgi:hypothetical protein